MTHAANATPNQTHSIHDAFSMLGFPVCLFTLKLLGKPLERFNAPVYLTVAPIQVVHNLYTSFICFFCFLLYILVFDMFV